MLLKSPTNSQGLLNHFPYLPEFEQLYLSCFKFFILDNYFIPRALLDVLNFVLHLILLRARDIRSLGIFASIGFFHSPGSDDLLGYARDPISAFLAPPRWAPLEFMPAKSPKQPSAARLFDGIGSAHKSCLRSTFRPLSPILTSQRMTHSFDFTIGSCHSRSWIGADLPAIEIVVASLNPLEWTLQFLLCGTTTLKDATGEMVAAGANFTPHVITVAYGETSS
ncbi:hypothetical protein Cni_G09849 [Canna indica]|uniref:Uncharacterized protein n=1 Tax=Canna indica TaxID=4628 RepID=A0AAQ3K382_9LILI|nr:hypothetical protein Cni_G09849 [Canna indica]